MPGARQTRDEPEILSIVVAALRPGRRLPPSKVMLTLLSVLALGSWPCQDPVPSVPVLAAGLSDVLWDRQADGSLIALAPSFKAQFAVHGAVTFVPFLGAAAPRNFPVTFRLQAIERGGVAMAVRAAAAPRFAGARVTFAHAEGVLEHWDARADEVEQTFTLVDYAGEGDLVVTLAVDTDLECADTPEGLCFAVPGLGGVVYGDVLAFDATRAEVRAPARWRDGTIELRIPAAFVAAARGPLTIDPVVRSFSIAGGSDDQRRAEVAYDPIAERFLVVFTRVFSLIDGDVLARRFTRDGVLLDEVAVAIGFIDSDNAAVGVLAPVGGTSAFLVAWDEGRVANRVVLGRRRSPFSTTQGDTFTIRAVAGLSCTNPAVGGSIAGDANLALCAVVWQQSDGILGFARIANAGAVSSFGLLTSAPGVATDPAITRARRNNEVWVVCYRVAVGTGHEVQGVVLSPALVALARPQVVMAAARHGPPSIAGTNQDGLVVASRAMVLGAGDVIGARVRVGGTTLSVIAEHTLSLLEPGTSRTADQRDPVVAFDGCRFAYAYREQVGTGSDYDAFAATLSFSGATPLFHEGHHALVASANSEEAVAFAGSGEMGGAAAESFVVVEQVASASDHDLLGALYRAASPRAGVRTVRTRCLVDANIAIDNVPVLGNRVRITSPVAVGSLPLMLLGFEAPPIALCSGCRLGVGPIVSSLPTGTLDLLIPCNPGLIGADLAVQNILVNHPSGCAPLGLPLSIQTSDTLILTIG